MLEADPTVQNSILKLESGLNRREYNVAFKQTDTDVNFTLSIIPHVVLFLNCVF